LRYVSLVSRIRGNDIKKKQPQRAQLLGFVSLGFVSLGFVSLGFVSLGFVSLGF